MSALNELIQCPICLENYDIHNRIPMMLSACQHSLCKLCLYDLNETRTRARLECPICRNVINSNIHDIPKNRFLVQYLETLNPNVHSNSTNISSSNKSKLSDNDRNFSMPTAPLAPQASLNNVHGNSFNIPVYYENTNNSQPEWDERKYFRKIFDDIDHNHDGEINFQELHEALKKGQPNSEFDSNTVQILLQKYDQNNDNEISFDEFYNLFIGINEQFNEFLDIDVDFSGTIDSRELAMSLNRKNYNLSQQFFNYLIDEISKRTHKNTITFDMYVRVIARIDHLRKQYFHMNNINYKNYQNLAHQRSIEHYIANNFFVNF